MRRSPRRTSRLPIQRTPNPPGSWLAKPVRPLKARPGPGKKNRHEATALEDEQARKSLPGIPPAASPPPSLTSADLDRLVARSPDQERPQGRAGGLDDRRRVCPPDLFRPGRAAADAGAGSDFLERPYERQARPADRHVARQPEYARNWAKYWRNVIMFHSTAENPAQVRFDMLEELAGQAIRGQSTMGRNRHGNDHGDRPKR